MDEQVHISCNEVNTKKEKHDKSMKEFYNESMLVSMDDSSSDLKVIFYFCIIIYNYSKRSVCLIKYLYSGNRFC